MANQAAAPADDRRTTLASGGLGGLLVLLAVITLVQAFLVLDVGDSFALGPAAFPMLIGGCTLLVGAALVVRAVRQYPYATASEAWPAGKAIRLLVLLALLVGFGLVLPYAGYVLSSAVLFAGTAYLLGARHPWRMAAIGWTLACLVFLGFDRVIGLTLPAGPWGF